MINNIKELVGLGGAGVILFISEANTTTVMGIISALLLGYFTLRSRVIGTLKDDRDTYKERTETLEEDKVRLIAQVEGLKHMTDMRPFVDHLEQQTRLLREIHTAVVPPPGYDWPER